MSSFTDSRERTKKKRGLPKKASLQNQSDESEWSIKSGLCRSLFSKAPSSVTSSVKVRVVPIMSKASAVAYVSVWMLPVSPSFYVEHRNRITKYEGIMWRFSSFEK